MELKILKIWIRNTGDFVSKIDKIIYVCFTNTFDTIKMQGHLDNDLCHCRQLGKKMYVLTISKKNFKL
jgi:hypothetical protein